mmetsp:Transcript_18975/g.22592  ORF Transcript_18975/g.22592 Transcript_18975/m.22592 type:complete len:206 (-) Transcript_18975:228-845(-)
MRQSFARSEFMVMPYIKLVDSRGNAMTGPQTRPLPHLLEQEVLGYQSLLSVLLRILTGDDADIDKDNENKNQVHEGQDNRNNSNHSIEWSIEIAEPMFITTCTQILERYDSAERKLEHAWFQQNDNQNVLLLDYETRCLAPAAAHALRGILALDDIQFLKHKQWFYSLVVALVTSSSRSIRSLVQQILSGPIQRLVVLKDTQKKN